MQRLGWFLFGAFSLAVIGVGGTGFLVLKSEGFSANQQPGPVETWFARQVRSATVPRGARYRANPIADSPQIQSEARAHWADHCAGCHANDGSGESLMGKRTYPPAPDMRLAATQQMTDGELFYIIQNGIRFTAMPAWGGGTNEHSGHDEEDSWKLVRFIHHLPSLTWEEKKEMQQMNPKSPDEIKEEQEEEKFLKGETTNEPQSHHHPH
jgi:mono/diheme cytochrome c family protein